MPTALKLKRSRPLVSKRKVQGEGTSQVNLMIQAIVKEDYAAANKYLSNENNKRIKARIQKLI